MGLFVLELVQQFDLRVVPNLREGAFQHVAKGVITPELVGVNLAVPRNTADTATRAVALVILQEFKHFFGTLGIFALHAHPHVGAIGVVVDSEDFLGLAGVKKGAGFVHDKIEHVAGFGVIQIFLDQFGTTARVHQVIEAGAGYFQILEQAEDTGNFRHVALVDGKAQAHFEAFGLTVGNAFERFFESTGHAAKLVVHCFHAVQRNANVGKSHFLEFAGLFLGNERAVGGNNRAHALGGGVTGKFHQILAHQRFAAREQHDRRAVGRQIIDHGLGLLGIDIVRAVNLNGVGVAMHAFEVAALGHVPDHNGLLIFGELQQVRGQLARFASVTQGVGRLDLSAIQLGNAYHGLVLIVRCVVSARQRPRQYHRPLCRPPEPGRVCRRRSHRRERLRP